MRLIYQKMGVMTTSGRPSGQQKQIPGIAVENPPLRAIKIEKIINYLPFINRLERRLTGQTIALDGHSNVEEI